jgi:hypothetical protein
MNRENLQRMADHIRTVPQELFDMRRFRSGKKDTHECTSVGCIIGICTILDPEPLPMLNSITIDFNGWTKKITGMSVITNEWYWCFSMYWVDTDNTPTGAADRIEWLLNHGLPEDWEDQMCGDAPLCYKKDFNTLSKTI